MPEEAYYGYTADELKTVAGTAIGLTLGSLLVSPVDGWGLHRVALALGSGAVAAVVVLIFLRL